MKGKSFKSIRKLKWLKLKIKEEWWKDKWRVAFTERNPIRNNCKSWKNSYKGKNRNPRKKIRIIDSLLKNIRKKRSSSDWNYQRLVILNQIKTKHLSPSRPNWVNHQKPSNNLKAKRFNRKSWTIARVPSRKKSSLTLPSIVVMEMVNKRLKDYHNTTRSKATLVKRLRNLTTLMTIQNIKKQIRINSRTSKVINRTNIVTKITSLASVVEIQRTIIRKLPSIIQLHQI